MSTFTAVVLTELEEKDHEQNKQKPNTESKGKQSQLRLGT